MSKEAPGNLVETHFTQGSHPNIVLPEPVEPNVLVGPQVQQLALSTMLQSFFDVDEHVSQRFGWNIHQMVRSSFLDWVERCLRNIHLRDGIRSLTYDERNEIASFVRAHIIKALRGLWNKLDQFADIHQRMEGSRRIHACHAKVELVKEQIVRLLDATLDVSVVDSARYVDPDAVMNDNLPCYLEGDDSVI